jgi:hypothetical protein
MQDDALCHVRTLARWRTEVKPLVLDKQMLTWYT